MNETNEPVILTCTLHEQIMLFHFRANKTARKRERERQQEREQRNGKETMSRNSKSEQRK